MTEPTKKVELCKHQAIHCSQCGTLPKEPEGLNEKITKEIDRLVTKYPWSDSKELFRAELEYLAMVANREGFAECTRGTLEVLSKPNQ